MVVQGCDYSFARPDPVCLHASGIRFAVRYTSIGPSGKNMSPDEVRALTAAGLAVVTVFEETAGHVLGGRAAGVAAAQASVALASSCGMPLGRPHYFALDIDPRALTTAQWDAVKAYLAGAASILGHDQVGVYGGWKAIEELVPDHAPWGWQTYAWSDGRWSPKAVLQQYRNGITRCGGQIDLDQALAVDYGQWGGGLSVADADDILREIAELRTFYVQTERNADHGDKTIQGILHPRKILNEKLDVVDSRLIALERAIVAVGLATKDIAELLGRVSGADPQTVATATIDELAARTAPRPPA